MRSSLYLSVAARDLRCMTPPSKATISSLVRIIHNPTRKRGTSNKTPRLCVGLPKAVVAEQLLLPR